MDPWAPTAMAAAALLVVTGAAKLLRPAASAALLAAVVPGRAARPAARILGGIEVGIAAVVLLNGSRWATDAMAVLYAGFAVVSLVGISRSVASCGCTGRVDTPPSRAHVAMNVVFAVDCLLAGIAGERTSVHSVLVAGGGLQDVAVLTAAVSVVWLAWAVLGAAGRREPTQLATRRAAGA